MSTLTRPAMHTRRARSLLSRMWASYELGRSRARLRDLPDHLLEDIGITRDEARAESKRATWDVPSWWRG